jgi:nucleoid-associated protein YgaU
VTTLRSTRRLALALVLAAPLAACGDRPGPVLRTGDVAPAPPAREVPCTDPPRSPGAPTVWRVRAGDTLAAIAKRCYGDSRLWTEIVRANPALGERRTLRIGETLVVPDDVR